VFLVVVLDILVPCGQFTEFALVAALRVPPGKRLQQDDALSGHGFLAADAPDRFPGLCLDVDLLFGDSQQLSQTLSDPLLVCGQLRALCEHDAVEICDTQSCGLDLFDSHLQEFGRITVTVIRCRIGEPLANVTPRDRAE
jgi:hypothetical protein